MIERVGNLALLEGPAIIVHGVNGGWSHGPKFAPVDADGAPVASFAASLAERGPMARASYMALEMGNAEVRDRCRTMIREHWSPGRGVHGLPLGWAFPRRIEGDVWLVHGVTQRSVRGTKEKARDGKYFVRKVPADIGAVAAVLDSTVAFMRRLAERDGAALPLHMPRIGCGLGGLDWDDVRALVERVEARANVPLANASEGHRALCSRWPVNFNVWSKGAA